MRVLSMARRVSEEEAVEKFVSTLVSNGFKVWTKINRIDIIASDGNVIIAIEVKRTGGDLYKAIGQALRNSEYVDKSYVGLPKIDFNKEMAGFFKQLPIGLITLNGGKIRIINEGKTNPNPPKLEELKVVLSQTPPSEGSEQKEHLSEAGMDRSMDVNIISIPDELLTVPGLLFKIITTRGKMSVYEMTDALIHRYMNERVAASAVSRAIRQLEHLGLVREVKEDGGDKRRRVYELV